VYQKGDVQNEYSFRLKISCMPFANFVSLPLPLLCVPDYFILARIISYRTFIIACLQLLIDGEKMDYMES
jgi:hypothetical protein